MQSWESELILLNQKNARPHIKPSVICQTEAAITIMFKYDFTPIIPRENYMLPIKQVTHRLKSRGRGRQSQFEINQSSTDLSYIICNWRGGVSQREFIAYVLVSWFQWQISLFHRKSHIWLDQLFSQSFRTLLEKTYCKKKNIFCHVVQTRSTPWLVRTLSWCVFLKIDYTLEYTCSREVLSAYPKYI